MSPIQVYKSGSIGDPFSVARTAMVTTLEAFKAELDQQNITPNITAAFDNHKALGSSFPYATVGLLASPFVYKSKAGTAFDVLSQMNVEIRIHIAPRDGQYDERIKWALLQSLVNYMKNVSTIHADINALWLRSVNGDRVFPLGTVGGSMTVELWKVLSG